MKKSLNIPIDEDLRKRVRMEAIRQSITLEEAVAQALRLWLEHSKDECSK
jgi:predicted HicB family RNase H-like nuclease